MKTQQLEIVNAALKPYGAVIGELGEITKSGKVLSVRCVTKNKRLRFEGENGTLIASGPVHARTVESFVEKFWFWAKSG